jgi:hypothetical protein
LGEGPLGDKPLALQNAEIVAATLPFVLNFFAATL